MKYIKELEEKYMDSLEALKEFEYQKRNMFE